jgi:tetratricopeptide (TPR) repeat protein
MAAVGVLAMLPIAVTHALYAADQSDAVSEQLLLARLKQHSGEYRAARDILSTALSETPNCVSLLNQLGSVEQDLGEYFEAERSYLRALSLSTATSGDRERMSGYVSSWRTCTQKR